jgi:DNA repair exonuclease SbcCD ATPase subunit
MKLEDVSELSLSVENISGLAGRREFTLKPGVNLITAPNAAGKTSLIHALQTLVLEERELSSKAHFLHSFEQNARVELAADGVQWVRRIRGVDGGLSVGGDAVHPEGKKVATFCIASEDNELVERVRTASPLRSTLLDFSDYKHYELLEAFMVAVQRGAAAELTKHRDLQNQIEVLNDQLRRKQEQLETLERERRNIKDIPAAKIARNEDEAKRLATAQRELSNVVREITTNEGEIQRGKDGLETLINQEQRMRQAVQQFENEHPDAEQELAAMDREIRESEGQIKDLRAEMESTQARLQDTSHNWNRHLKYGENECFACGEAISPEKLRERQRDLEGRVRELQNDLTSIQWSKEQRQKERNQLSEHWIQIKSDYRSRLNEASRRIATASERIKQLEDKLHEVLPRRAELSEQVKQLEAAFDRDVRELLEQQRQVDESIARTDQDIRTISARIDDIGDTHGQIVQLQTETAFLDQAIRFVAEKAEHVKEAVRTTFNEGIGEVYALLEFNDDFEQIYLDDAFNLKIIRRYQGSKKADSVHTLSRGERETVALVLMLAGRDAYLDDFPFFIADETTFYDATRFQRIVDYIRQRVPYTIITTHVPKADQTDLRLAYAV